MLKMTLSLLLLLLLLQAMDSTDGLLQAERQHLVTLKRSIESEQKLIHQHLQVLDAARRRLSTASQERGRALDLVSHSLPPGIYHQYPHSLPPGPGRSKEMSRHHLARDWTRVRPSLTLSTSRYRRLRK